ncbi:MAG: NAD(P)H-quinone oxidoreductase subunit N [Cyanothece sp. SIO2G6]|nr:NAD(P)H-quinone oxidoreductase subunit N [Cyanothece sp. SIO2G6]
MRSVAWRENTLIITGQKFIKALESSGALGVYAPLEGGYEGRYQRRLRAAGYSMLPVTARGLGDVSAYLFDTHGVRPAHLGKKNIERTGAVGARHFVPGVAQQQLDLLPSSSKGLVIWLIEGMILSRQELEFLADLPKSEPNVKVVVELGGDRVFSWQSLADCLVAA